VNLTFYKDKIVITLLRLFCILHILSHEYYGITDDKLFRLIQKTAVIREFTGVMQQTIKQHGGESA